MIKTSEGAKALEKTKNITNILYLFYITVLVKSICKLIHAECDHSEMHQKFAITAI